MTDFTQIDFNAVAVRLHPERPGLFKQSPVRLIGIRGANDGAGQQNSFARYDDVIVVDASGTRSVWAASTDPSWTLVVHPINADGAAQLLPGIHLFEKHLMHAGTPRQHWCLGQAEDVHVNRLNDDGSVRGLQVGQFGICIHSGGDGMDTGRFSAGCQIIQNRDGYFQDPTWSRFWEPIRDAMTTHALTTVPYLLITNADL